MAFVVPPRPKSAGIPVITVEELAHALLAYLPTVFDFKYRSQDLDTSEDSTQIFFYGTNPNQGNANVTLEITIDGKKVRSWQSKLFNMNFHVKVYERPSDFVSLKPEILMKSFNKRMHDVIVEPRADRSIALHPILKS